MMRLQRRQKPVLNDVDNHESLKGLNKVDTWSDLHFKYIPHLEAASKRLLLCK